MFTIPRSVDNVASYMGFNYSLVDKFLEIQPYVTTDELGYYKRIRDDGVTQHIDVV